MQFATGGVQALNLMEQQSFDVIVSDMRMPGMDGAQLLNQVLHRSPSTVRIMLSGQSEQEQILRAIGPVHQYLSKPCSPDVLTNAIERACALRELFSASPLLTLVAGISKLPSIPRVYQQLVDALKSTEVSMSVIGDLISQDLAISSRVLQLANSCLFGCRTRIESPFRAASVIGLERLRALTLSAGVFSQFTGHLPKEISLDDLMQRTLATSVLAQQLIVCEDPNNLETANNAMLAGIVADVGHLIMLQQRTDDYPQLLESAQFEGIPVWEMEQRHYRVTHAELGAYLIGLWGLPDIIVEAVAFHHTPSDCLERKFGILTAVHVASALLSELDCWHHWPFGGTLDDDYLIAIGKSHRLPVWRARMCALLAENAN